jgi:hypothetical protein
METYPASNQLVFEAGFNAANYPRRFAALSPSFALPLPVPVSWPS